MKPASSQAPVRLANPRPPGQALTAFHPNPTPMQSTRRIRPSGVADLREVTAIAAGFAHTAALVVHPTVTALPTGNNLTLSWPDTAAGYQVESALNLSLPVFWSTVTGTLQTNGGFIRVVLPLAGPQKLYRLTKP